MNTMIKPRVSSMPGLGVPAAVGFLLAYLAVGFTHGALSDRDLPLPDAPAAEAAAYYAANPLAAGVTAALQAISVLCFAVVMRFLIPLVRQAGRDAASRLRAAGLVSVTAMLLSSASTGILAILATPDSVDLVAVLRQASFYTGGVGTVAALGVFVLGSSLILGRTDQLGKPTRWFGYIAGTLAMLSVLSLAIYYANAFLPIGRVLSMVWTVVATTVLFRRGMAPQHDRHPGR